MERWKGKVAIVTGASLGIGASISEQLADLGITVVGVARRKDRLSEVEKKLKGRKGKFYSIVGDVSKEEDLLEVFKWIKQNIGPVHILINNAGSYREKGLLDGETTAWKETLDTNILGLCVATREAIKDMRANNVDGHVIHISSIVTNDRLPNVNVYIASKQAVTTLTETLRHELNGFKSKIKVSCITPGGVRSSLGDPTSGSTTNDDLLEFYKSAPLLETRDIADAVIYVLSTPPHVQVHDLIIRPIGEFI